MRSEIAIIGGGMAGLSCARELAALGGKVTVLERARGVGGRCATRRVQGQPVDFGAVFVHGADPEFVRAVEEVEGASLLQGWPVVRAGAGTPCQPDAFRPNEYRAAYAEGMSALPKWMARGLQVRLNTRVTSIAAGQGCVRLSLADGSVMEAGAVVIAQPAEDIREMIEPLRDGSEELLAAWRLLEMISTFPSATVLAGYPLDVPAPDWHVDFPEQSQVIQLISHDSSKRPDPKVRVFVYQALPGWSRTNLARAPSEWAALLLQEAARVLGAWAASPAWMQAHAWRRARVDRGNELASPILVELGGGGRIGMCGEVFAPGGGVEAAWLSGRNLARRMAGGSR